MLLNHHRYFCHHRSAQLVSTQDNSHRHRNDHLVRPKDTCLLKLHPAQRYLAIHLLEIRSTQGRPSYLQIHRYLCQTIVLDQLGTSQAHSQVIPICRMSRMHLGLNIHPHLCQGNRIDLLSKCLHH